MYQRQLTFQEAVDSAVKNHYCDFNGRASRSEYWWFVLFTFILGVAFGLLRTILGDWVMYVNYIVSLALFLPSLGVAVRRLHDIGRSGWWILIGLIPLVGAILLIIWFCKDSQMESNEYGEVPNMTER